MSEHRDVQLSKLCSIARRRGTPTGTGAYVGLEHIAPGSGLLTPTTISGAGVKSSTFCFDDQMVLYGKLRPYLNKVALPNFSGFCSTDILPLIPAEGVDRRLLAALLRSPDFVGRVSQLTTGANLPRVSPDALMTVIVRVPTDPDTLSRVMVAMDALDGANTALSALAGAVAELAAFPGALLAVDA